MELHLHTAIFVRPDTLPLRPHDFRRLRAVGARPRRGLRRTVHHRRRDDREIGPVYGFPLAAGVAVLFEVVTRRRHQILAVVAEERRVGQGEGVARRNPRRRGGGLNLLVLNLPALLTDAGIKLPVPLVHKATRPVVHVDAARRRRCRVLLGLEQPRVRLAEVIVVEAVNPRRHAVLQRPLADALFIRTAA